MTPSQLNSLYNDQSKDPIWMIDLDFQLIYANKRWLDLVKEVTGKELKLYESAFAGGFGEGYIEKWKTYYSRALKGEYFEIEEHYSHPETNEIHYGQITLEPLRGDDGKIFAIACQSRDITSIVKHRSEANQLIDASLDIFCTINEQGNFVFVSAAASTHWGYLPKELIGKAYVDFILEEDLPKTSDIAASILRGQDVKSFVNRYKKKNGGIAYNLWSVTWDNTSKLMYCTIRDAKELIDQEEKIKQSEQRFKALVQEGSDLISILNPDGKYIYTSPTSISVLGITPEELKGRNAFEFIHPDDAERVLASLQKISTENKLIIGPFRYKNKKDEWRWLETVLTNMLDNPAVNGIVANSRDITHGIEEKHQLKLLESVITNTNDAVLITEAEPFDEPGPKIIYVNEAFTKMTGYEAEEVIGKTPRMLQGPKSNGEELAKLGRSLKKWEPYEITTINYKKSGEEFWINFTVTPVADEKGCYTHWIAIERDVTEQKNKEREKNLISTISDIFNQSAANDLTKCLTEVCEYITQFGHFDFAEIWLPAIDAKTINRVSKYVEGKAGSVFYDTAKNKDSFALGEGIPGHIWLNEMTEIWEDIDEEWHFFKRKVAAEKAGIKAMMGVPLKHKNEVVGVLLLGTAKTKSAIGLHLELFEKLESTIGAELSRKKTEIELAQIFNFTPDMICVSGFDGYIKRINPAGLELLGYSLEEMRSRPIKSFIHEEDKLKTQEKWKHLYNGGSLRNFENRYITKRGDSVWLSWTASPAPEHGIVYSVAKNITEEKKLRELDRQVRSITKIGSWELDLLNQSLFWSEEVHLLHETDPKSFVPDLKKAINFYRADFREMVRSSIKKCIANKEPYDFEAVLVTANKKELWVRTNGTAEFVDGVCTRIYGSFQDIDERKQIEIRLLSLADNLPAVVYQYIFYPDGTDALKYVTKGSQQVWGFAAEEVIENNQLVWERMAVAGAFETVNKSIADAMETKTKWTARWQYAMPNGETRTHLGYGSPIFLADGSVVFNSVILDVTNEAKNEALLEQITKIARIGSWEMDLVNQDGDNMYWSPMLFEIVEVDDSYNPTLTGGIEFHIGESKERIQKALDLLINEGVEFDEEILLRTAKGNERWSRAIGKSEIVDNKCIRIYGSYQDIHERKVAALELEKSLKALKDYKFSLDQSAIIAFTNEKGVITSVNANFCKISKYNEEEIIGKTHRLINSKHHAKAFFKELWKTIASGNVWRGEIKNKAKDGSYYWVDTTIVPFLDKKNKPTQYLAIRFDITERKNAEQEKNSLQETLENSLNEIYTFNAETLKFSYVNKGALLNMGYSEQEIKALTPVDIKPDFTAASFEQLVIPLVSNEKNKIIFFTNHKRKDGSLYPVVVHLQLITQENNKRFLAIVLDITERKKAEEENRFKANLLSMIGQAAIATNLDGVVNYWNNAAETIYGWKAEEALGKNIMDLTPFKATEVQAKQIMEELKKGERWSGEFEVRKKDGTNFPAQVTNSPIYDEHHKLSGIIGISSDITQEVKNKELLKQYTHELERSNEELEQFAFVTSHDLQEPLRMISSFMTLLQRKYGDQLDDKAHQYIHFATDGAKQMKQIILDLLEYSRANASTEGKEDVDLNEVLSEFKQLRRRLISEKSASITSSDLPSLTTYSATITQIFHCLLDNALKYSKDGTAPIIEIKASEHEKEWEFSIKDNGIGIDPQFYDKIFVIFQRLHNKDEYSGTGIGLSIVKRHIEFLGGRIWLDSKPGEGTVFYFTISKIKQHG
ncbi:PAS domain S-box protein [Subsaximicrobium wynnwilliamsii]|uniref:histidine kinase n=1 Tax=Subsaximicrobium wynnwilliamsii TaxID=291179 RepID=A0A5C6ZJX1_9FLAO|nr:PAS domain S-box protein [Subsaximicrobium wynnwilliamsii]TXD84093.1 PAS domain S-box protein [Subsaximicrobium wynnwilliamsii]TXD88949.1 PAS domain S-box protein [Subsaximicrobium wynnwilliamsii]TXE03805.1 PAS domain S-box protein [Subsaximicrobium wynnwilliamsii]